jgi:ketosteroid isomerase-like protein
VVKRGVRPDVRELRRVALRIDRIHDAGGVVVFEGRVTGLTKADGRPDASTAWLWTVRDGRIVSYHNNDLE